MEPKHHHINYLYFGALFALLVFLSAGSIFTKENLGGSQFFFFLYALGQVFLEVALFTFTALLIRRYLNKFCFCAFIGITFVALFIHISDFLMDRILDLSTWESLKVFVLQENWENFFYLLDASGVPLWAWFLLFFILGSLPFLGVFLYKMSDMIVQKKPVVVRQTFLLQTLLCIPCALFFWDFSASRVIAPDAYTSFIKSLPWKFTFIQPESVLLNLPGPALKPQNEDQVAWAIDQNQTQLEKRPNIYLFVVESLREDSITQEIAPHLTAFKNENLHFERAISNGNGTHLSWYSIFHSQFPYSWNHELKNWKMGSPALNLLKKWGYQIRLYTSAQLAYYGMEERLFGEEAHLLDSYQTFHHAPPVSAADTDAALLAKMQQDLTEHPELQEGQVFIVFWDTTHFDYSWPKNWSPKFKPFAKELAYFKAFQSDKTVASIKNRYHNSVNYMDQLFGQFMASLPKSEEAIVIFTGDHGEEFFEHGHLFHNSHLSHEQTNIPLYFKFGATERKPADRELVSQMDIFPSIIDYISGTRVAYLEGNSLFRKAKWPYAVTARFNAGNTPYEFSIHNGQNKLIAQFPNRQNIFENKQIQLLSLRTWNDKSIPEFKDNAAKWVHDEFDVAIERLFQGSPSKGD